MLKLVQKRMTERSTLERLREALAAGADPAGRLPPERELAVRLGTSRGTLRRALATLEEEGLIWRGVGRGTFLREHRPERAGQGGMVLDTTNPMEVMEARLVLEPELSGLAALKATPVQLAELDEVIGRSREAGSVESFERLDSAFHRGVARTSGNRLLLGLFDALNAARSGRLWGQLKARSLTAERMAGYCDQHATVLRAMAERDRRAATEAMRAHLQTVRQNFLDA